MNCDICFSPTKVLETRKTDTNATRRRRICTACRFRFTTHEFPVSRKTGKLMTVEEREQYERRHDRKQ